MNTSPFGYVCRKILWQSTHIVTAKYSQVVAEQEKRLHKTCYKLNL